MGDRTLVMVKGPSCFRVNLEFEIRHLRLRASNQILLH
jgi:hypothetical protein